MTTPKAGPWGGEIIMSLGLAGRETDNFPGYPLSIRRDEGPKLLLTDEKVLF